MDETTGVIVTVRLIRSFRHRNLKHIVLRNVDLDVTVEDFVGRIREDIKTRPGLPPPFRKHGYDTLKIEYKAYGSKTTDPVINKENDEKLILKADQTLGSAGVENETEISCFKREEYEEYKKDSTVVW